MLCNHVHHFFSASQLPPLVNYLPTINKDETKDILDLLLILDFTLGLFPNSRE